MVFRSLRFNKHRKNSNSLSSTQTSGQPQSQQRPGRTPLPEEDDDSIPQTAAEARKHIAKIRAEKGLESPSSNNTADLQAALVVLSQELYQKSTHFLWELVQNADDNSYNVAKPTLTITYENRTLRIDCNEIGFSRKNVAAISRIGRSSKLGLDHSRRYIGEKGIGFKSVFKVSDVVWIHSGSYSFKFDKSEHLGMIAPIWADFPRETTHGVTSILMKLSDFCDVRELMYEIKALEPRLLIYLQKLKRIKITINEDSDGLWETTLDRHDQAKGSDGQQLVTLYHGPTPLSYRIFHFRVKDLPDDPKRTGHTESELVLAFPMNDERKPMIESQNVYAFLPVRDYGFKFLLQADFLLIASREDIDSSSPWNAALLDGIPHALHSAIKEFNDGELRYSWLLYLPFRPIIHRRLAASNQSDLRPRPIYRQGRLSKLGVRKLTTEDFISDVRTFILKHPVQFQSMLDAWHSRLVEALMISLLRSIFWKSTISAMKMVPLRDGRWASMNQGNFLFPARSGQLVIPKGIDVFEIHPTAESDDYRRQLFTALGAREFEAKQICDIIVKTHKSPEFLPSALTPSDLISHVVFLYKAGWKNTERHDIWFVTEGGSYCRGSQIYMNSDMPYSAQSIFAKDRLKVQFLHPDYYVIFSTQSLTPEVSSEPGDWQKWLVEQLHVSQIPRLANPPIGAPFSLSNEFQFILDTYLSTDLLLLIRHNWGYYSKWIVDKGRDETKSAWRVSQHKLRETISSINVKCRQGVSSTLNKSFLPLSSLQLESFVSVPFLDVPEPDNDEWDFLKHFGVIVELDASFFVECLRRLKDAPASKKQASQLYGQIDLWATHDKAGGITRSFKVHKLIFIPDESSNRGGTWVGIDECVWNGPACLRAIPCLEKHYPEHQHLLRDTLRVRDADIKTLVSEARHILATDEIDHIAQVFITISKYLEIANDSNTVIPLTESCIFPVATGKLQSGFNSLHSAAESEMWFIADRTHLKDSFENLVPLLAFDPTIVEQIGLLINALGLEHRLLSTVAKGVSKTKGKTSLHLGYTKSLRKRARCIARTCYSRESFGICMMIQGRLIPRESPNRADILRQLRKIEVYQSEKVIVEWVVTSPNGETFFGRADSGRVASSHGKQGLQIFLTDEDIHADLPPLELQEELARFGEITDPNHVTLLLYLLLQSDIKSIEDTFHRRGIPNDVPEFDSISDVENKEQQQSQIKPGSKPEPQPKNRIFQIRLRRKARTDEDASEKLGAFVKRVERIKRMQKKIDDPWGGPDVTSLFMKICRLEKRDASLLLPQDTKIDMISGNNSGSGSLLDLKTGIWKDLMAEEEYSKTWDTDTFSAPASVLIKPVPQIDEETQYIGELYVSTFLEMKLGEAYMPNKHWTSRLRSKRGHMPYENAQEESSTFTFIDHSGAFTDLLSQLGYSRAGSWTKSPIYHIKVVVCQEDVLSKFSLSPLEVKK
ncbi:hypothetical protein F5884DRAFT_745017 [Xylogone sp. PMI_703]|nr:hypothetical protein F5884DRAFT_745017 [Xylogone sp. PMI_703]